MYTNNWHHMVLNYLPGDSARVYKDTVDVGGEYRSTNVFAGDHASGPGLVVVGKTAVDYNSNYADTDVDELLFFNEVLTSAEITEIGNMA